MISFDSNINEDFLARSYEWFLDEDLRVLTMTEPFTREDQRKWFNSLACKYDYIIYGIRLDGSWIGACGLKGINRRLGSAEYYGYIGRSLFRGRGIGRLMLEKCKSEALRLGLSELTLRVSHSNSAAIHLYRKTGFRVIGANLEFFEMSRKLTADDKNNKL
jgi:RimJ/RimL family protein N-acetyltransferase